MTNGTKHNTEQEPKYSGYSDDISIKLKLEYGLYSNIPTEYFTLILDPPIAQKSLNVRSGWYVSCSE